MTLYKDGPLPSDEITALIGFDGTESKDVVGWYRKFGSLFPARLAFAVNQHYPELQSGHYLNKRLVSLIQKAIEELGMSVVIEDNYRRDGIVPVEPVGSLECADDYLLVDHSMDIRGRLWIWESLGGRGAFYHDKLVFDVLTGASAAEELRRVVAEACRSRNIMFAF